MAQKPAVTWTKPGEIRVILIDREEAPIPGVTVTLVPNDRHANPRVATANSKGRAGFVDVPPGEYTLRFQLSGFAECSVGPFSMKSSTAENPRLPEFIVMMNPLLWQ
jgi:hypothetical protein